MGKTADKAASVWVRVPVREGTEVCVPSSVLRRLATGVMAIPQPTDGRRAYSLPEYALALGVSDSTVYRWVQRRLIRVERKRGGFAVIPVAEAIRFSREGPSTPLPLPPRHPVTGQFVAKEAAP
jgi:hypothetical protein